MYIEKINGPEDVKKLSNNELTSLAAEMRQVLLKRASIHGGHFGPNFGMVEATIALHYVFESPKDKFVFDVSHQTYPHKMLTGRKDAYLYEEHYNDVSGYSNPEESDHDHFVIGHTSTSISLACGLAKGRDVRGESGNVIAIIGDGSLSGGEALEGLDFASELQSNLIIVVNDNDMSIAENHGGLYQNLKLLRETNGQAECNLFKAMGLDYVYVHDGNDIPALIKAFENVKDSVKPVVVHIRTLDRFVGGVEEERKLFYVAITRAKKFLFLTRSPGNAREKKVSEFMVEAKESPYMLGFDKKMVYTGNHIPPMSEDAAPLNLNFSILQDYFDCAYRFKLSMFYGFVQPIVPALGYGKTMHEIVMNIHRRFLSGETLSSEDIEQIVNDSFYLPYANPKLQDNMLEGAKKSIAGYVTKNQDDFANITMAEADIELDMGDGIKVNGRIDLVKRREISGEEKTYIVDFKTASREVTECINAEQLKIYALGYQKLTGKTADYLEIYNLDNSESERQRVTEGLLENVSRDIRDAASNIRNNDLPRKCSKEKCQKCYLNYLCLSKKEKQEYEV